MQKIRTNPITLSTIAVMVSGAFAATSLLATQAKAEPAGTHRLTFAIFGDSISRGVGADKTLGQEATWQEQLDLFHAIDASKNAKVLPENELLLNYQLMDANDFAARDPLAAVHGSAPYSIFTRLHALSDVKTEMLIAAHMGGSYHTGDAQLAAYKNLLVERGISSPDLVIVDLGRADFEIFHEPADFQKAVDHFFSVLTETSPAARILVTKIANIPASMNHPDRIAVRGLLGQDQTCSMVLRNSHIGLHNGLSPGADNTSVLPLAEARYEAYNAILAAKVASLQAEGRVVRFVQTFDDAMAHDAAKLDELSSDDCLHLNTKGQAMLAGNYWPAVQDLLAQPMRSVPPAPTPAPEPKTQIEDHLSSAGKQLWQSYLGSMPINDLQAECVPQIRWPDAAQGYRGVIFLVPGFTACPQQFRDVVDSLTARGYAVVLPVLPGEGRKWHKDEQGASVDQYQDLPTSKLSAVNSYRVEYDGFAQTMNDLAAQFSGEHVVGGISGGAILAGAMTSSRPYQWTRQLIISPFYSVHEGEQSQLFAFIDQADSLDPDAEDSIGALQHVINLGPWCEQSRPIRAGLCQFQAKHALALNRYGAEVADLTQPTTVKTQFVVVQDDPAIDQNRVFQAVGWQRKEKLGAKPFTTEQRFDQHPDVRICAVPSDNQVCAANKDKAKSEQDVPCVSHALLFGYDDPRVNPYWVPTFSAKMVDFLTTGSFFAASDYARSNGDPLCADFPNH